MSLTGALCAAGPSKALAYARAHFAGFQETEMGEIQRLMGCLCFVKRPGSSPYSDLMAPAQWNEVAREFARQCCGLLGQVGNCNNTQMSREKVPALPQYVPSLTCSALFKGCLLGAQIEAGQDALSNPGWARISYNLGLSGRCSAEPKALVIAGV